MPSVELGFLRPGTWACYGKASPIRRSRTRIDWRQCSRCRRRAVARQVSQSSPPSSGIHGDADELLELEFQELGDASSSGFEVFQDELDLSVIADLYTLLMKQEFSSFLAAMVAAPVALSLIFTALYVPAFRELAYLERAFEELTPSTVFQIFMFSISLCTGLEPDVSPVSPYTLVLANVNALLAQLLFVFFSGAVFARLSQPSRPIKCSTVAIISREKLQSQHRRVLMTRFVLTGPQPCELVDVKIEITFKRDAREASGAFFRVIDHLKLVRERCFYLTHGMVVRHVINEQSPLYKRSPEMLRDENAVISLGVIGYERSSMQPVFHIQHYNASSGQIVWDSQFEDIILINKGSSVRMIDHSRLSLYKSEICC